MSAATFASGCACGAVRTTIYGVPLIVARCHCTMCRRTSGAGHMIGAVFRREEVRTTGELGRFTYISDNGSEVSKSFCALCGSPMLGANTRSPNHVTIPLGTIEEADGLSVQVTIFDACRQPWDRMDERVETFAGQPEWTPEDQGSGA